MVGAPPCPATPLLAATVSLPAQVRWSSNTRRKISLAQIGLREERQVDLHSFLGTGGVSWRKWPLSRGLKTEGRVVGGVFSLRVSLLQAYLSVTVKLKGVQDKDAVLWGSRDLNAWLSLQGR